MKKIISAKYGANDIYIDVLEIIKNKIPIGNEIEVNNENFTDPIYGVKKKLIIKYDNNSIEEIWEGEKWQNKYNENTEIKFRIFTPNYIDSSGGIMVLFVLGKIINDLGYECKMITFYGNEKKNSIYNNYTTNDDIKNSIVIYPEIIKGNPLNAKKVIRWILCDLGKNCDKDIYKTWGKEDIIYFYSSFDPLNNNIPKQLFCFTIDEKIKKYNMNERKNNCYTFRKANKFHKKINYIHNENDIYIPENLSLDQMIIIFNHCKFFYCYDPYTFYSVIAGLCGCIPIVYPIENISKKQWIDSLYCNSYLKNKKKDYLYGIAYGIEDINYAIETLELIYDEQKDLIDYGIITIKKMIEDIKNNNTINNEECYYKNFNLKEI